MIAIQNLVPAAALIVVLLTTPALAFDAEQTFLKNAVVVSVEGGYGEQSNFERHPFEAGLEFANGGVRVSLLPFGTTFRGPLRGALEVGLEPFYQRYLHPHHAFFAGLGAAGRYHFLALGRVVPYVEAMAAAGGTDLETAEIRSNLTFLLHAGAGLSVFVTDHVAIYAGYRVQHVSNGNTHRPNRGFESHTGVVGASVFFP